MARDPYNILQVAHHAESEVIEAAYKRLALKYHPDQNPSANATAHMQDINWAYQLLKDPAKRASYDRGVSPQAPPKPKPPPARPKPKPPPPKSKPKPPPPKPKAEPARQAPSPWWKPKPVGPTERRILRVVGAIGLILIAWFAIYWDPAPAALPSVTATIGSSPPAVSATPNNVKATTNAISTALESGTRVWNPTALPPSFGTALPSIGTVVVYNEERTDPVWVWTDRGAVAGYIPNGSICNLVEEETVQVYHLGEYYPLLEYKIECPSLGVIGWIEAEWTE